MPDSVRATSPPTTATKRRAAAAARRRSGSRRPRRGARCGGRRPGCRTARCARPDGSCVEQLLERARRARYGPTPSARIACGGSARTLPGGGSITRRCVRSRLARDSAAARSRSEQRDAAARARASASFTCMTIYATSASTTTPRTPTSIHGSRDGGCVRARYAAPIAGASMPASRRGSRGARRRIGARRRHRRRLGRDRRRRRRRRRRPCVGAPRQLGARIRRRRRRPRRSACAAPAGRRSRRRRRRLDVAIGPSPRDRRHARRPHRHRRAQRAQLGELDVRAPRRPRPRADRCLPTSAPARGRARPRSGAKPSNTWLSKSSSSPPRARLGLGDQLGPARAAGGEREHVEVARDAHRPRVQPLVAQEALEIVGEVVRALVAILGVLLERAHHDRLERGREVAARERRRLDLALDQPLHDLLRGAAEQPLADGDLVEHDAEREDVAAVIDLAARRLLGRHVAELAGQHVAARCSGRARARCRSR